MVDLTSLILALRSSLWETGVGNLPAGEHVSICERRYEDGKREVEHTLGETGTQETWDLLDEGIGSDEGIILASKLLDELLVLVELLQVISGHGVDTTVLRTIDIMLVTENAIPPLAPASCIYPCMYSSLYAGGIGFDVPDAHARAGDDWETDGSRETLVTLRVIVLEADLELDGLEEVSLLGLEGVLKELLDVGTHSGCGKLLSVTARAKRGWRGCARRSRGWGRCGNVPTVILDMMTVFQ